MLATKAPPTNVTCIKLDWEVSRMVECDNTPQSSELPSRPGWHIGQCLGANLADPIVHLATSYHFGYEVPALQNDCPVVPKPMVLPADYLEN